jgi:hypothetical protein
MLKNLLHTNLYKKHIVISIMEVFVITLGVLLGLYLENYAEDEEKKERGKQYLIYISSDLREDIIALDKSFISVFPRKIESLALAKKYNIEKKEIISVKKFLMEISYGAVFSTGITSLNQSTYIELVSTGNLSLIKNIRIRKKIIDYYSYVNKIINRQDRYLTDYMTYINSRRPFNRKEPNMISNYDSTHFINDLKSTEFYHLINLEMTFAYDTINVASKLKDDAENLVKTLEKEIK